MKKLILPVNYKEKVEKAIVENDRGIACSFMELYKFVIAQNDLSSIYPGQLSLSKDVMKWLLDIQKNFEEYTDVTGKEWKLLLLQKGPSINEDLESRTVLFFETYEELRKEKYKKNFDKVSKVYLDYQLNQSDFKIIEKKDDKNEEAGIAG